MTLLPVIERELRTQARRAFTYGLRVLGALLLLATALYLGTNGDFKPGQGGELFLGLNFALFCAIWVFVPLLAADCISREKREGTLGLLFLTPLKARDIVLAKGLIHGLRAMTLWLAVLPILVIPLVLGGVAWQEAVMSVLMNFCCLCWALAAGLLASALGSEWLRSVLLAAGLAVACLIGFVYVNGFCLVEFSHYATRGYYHALYQPYPTATLERILTRGFTGATGLEGAWTRMFLANNTASGRVPARLLLASPAGAMPRQMVWAAAIGVVTLTSVVALLLAVGVAARCVQASWRQKPRAAWSLRVESVLCTPVLWTAFLKRWMRRTLERNPIGWLERRTWSGRLVTWGWFAVMVSLYTLAFNDVMGRSFGYLQRFMAWLLLGSLAMAAAGSFRRERESGVLELLLVSPMSEKQIIGGRLRGLWGQFLPALVVLLGIWIYFDSFAADYGNPVFHQMRMRRDVEQFGLIVSSFLALPVIGLFFSLQKNNFMGALVFTLLGGLVVPVGLPKLLGYVISLDYVDTTPSYEPFHSVVSVAESWITVSILQCVFAALLGWLLHRDLKRRNFNFSGERSGN